MSLPLQRNFRFQAHGAAHPRTASWVEKAARAGYATSGIVYFVFAALALSAALGTGHRPPDGRGDVILHIAQQPFGSWLLAITAAGLAGFALWRAVQAVFDPERRKGGFEGVTRRIGEALGAFTYGALCVLAIQLLRGERTDAEAHKTWVARVLSEPYGAVVIAALGAIIIVVGGVQIYRAITVKFGDLLRWHQMSLQERRFAVWTGRLGLFARAVVFFVIGYFVTRAARTHDPSRVKDVGQALAELGRAEGGQISYVVVSLGFVAFALYQFMLSRYRRIEPRL